MKYKLFFLLLSAIAVAQEVSVFGAGDLNSKEPYGLTKTEQYIVKNRDELDSIDTKVKDIQSLINSINQRIDGLESIYESDSRKLNNSVLQINEFVKRNDASNIEIDRLKELTGQILKTQEENNINNNQNIENLKTVITKLEASINEINSSYISEKEFKTNTQQFVTKKELERVKNVILKEINGSLITTTSSSQTKQEGKLSNAELLNQAKELFKDDFFTKALPIFTDLINKKYKPAESSFYVGQINYYRKNYSEAIRYFKESALLYDKADYMPRLLLHSAISFEKTNDLSNARNFYNTLVNIYPNSQEAKTANENLNKIK